MPSWGWGWREQTGDEPHVSQLEWPGLRMMACGGRAARASGEGNADADVQRNVPDGGDANT